MKIEQWEKNTSVALTVLALLYLVSYSWQVLDYTNETLVQSLEVVNLVIWALFVVDYVVRLTLVSERKTWFWRNFFDFLVVILPALRPLRLLRLVVLLRVLNRTAGGAVRSQILTFAIGATILLVYVAALAVLEAERSEGELNTIGETIWWAIVTITTVGYGDYAPVTVSGRAVAVGLMAGGVVLVGVIVGTLSSWIVEKVGEGVEERQEDQMATITLLRDDIRQLRESLDREAPDADKTT
jgi:voltage-gated potassium channel